MKEKSTSIVIEFKNPLNSYYENTNQETAPNLLIVEIGPNENFLTIK